MSVTSTNLIQGPASLWRGAFGAIEPIDIDTEPSTPWADLGATKDGISLIIADEYSTLEVDQVVYEVGRRRTKRIVQVKTQLAEATLENLAFATNNTAPTAEKMEGDDGLTAFAPDYSAIILDGIAPGGYRRRLIVRKTLATDSVESAYKKDGMTLIPVTFTCHWVSTIIKPFDVEDATA